VDTRSLINLLRLARELLSCLARTCQTTPKTFHPHPSQTHSLGAAFPPSPPFPALTGPSLSIIFSRDADLHLFRVSQQPPPCRSSATTEMPGLVTSAVGVLAFLADEEPELKVFALKTLNDDVDTWWTEVAGSLSRMLVPS
jgi:hypothetical protein